MALRPPLGERGHIRGPFLKGVLHRAGQAKWAHYSEPRPIECPQAGYPPKMGLLAVAPLGWDHRGLS